MIRDFSKKLLDLQETLFLQERTGHRQQRPSVTSLLASQVIVWLLVGVVQLGHSFADDSRFLPNGMCLVLHHCKFVNEYCYFTFTFHIGNNPFCVTEQNRAKIQKRHYKTLITETFIKPAKTINFIHCNSHKLLFATYRIEFLGSLLKCT